MDSDWLVPPVPVDPARLSAAERVDTLVALERLRGWTDAQQLRLLAVMAPAGERDGKEWVREEIACALRIAPVTVNDRLQVARELTLRLPDTLAHLEAGRITLRHATALVDTCAPLSDTVTAQVQADALPRAVEQTPTAFLRTVRRLAASIDPADAETRHHRAAAERRMTLRPVEDGMAELWALLPTDAALRLMRRIDRAAAALTQPGDQRRADQRRADALCTRGTSAPASAGGVEIQVVVPLSTLLSLDDQPAELDGYGPIPASLARRLAVSSDSTWRRLVTDPLGRLLDHGRGTYRPPAALEDHVRTRDRTCRFPGCHRRARRCDLDHQQPWQEGGTTDAGNLECLCPRHHHLKHDAGWSVTGNPTDDLTWTTPTGHRYRDPPHRLPTGEGDADL